jgi:hypothetical protein
MEEKINSIIDFLKQEQDIFNQARLLWEATRTHQIPLKTVSERLGIKPSYLSHILRLNKLPDIIRDGHYSGIISVSHLFIIARVKEVPKMIEIYERVLGENLTALQTDELVRNALYNIESAGDRITVEEINKFASTQREKDKHIRARVVQTRVRGKILIEITGNFQKTTPLLREYIEKLK